MRSCVVTNFDEALLRSRRLDPAAPYPLIQQALRIALYDEYAAHAYYAGVVAAFGPAPPFVNIVDAEVRHIEALGRLCDRYGVPRPYDPFPAETEVAPTWRANLEQGVTAEIANVQLYDHLLAATAAPDLRQVFLNLQAASRDNHLPAFARALGAALDRESWHARRGLGAAAAQVRHGPLTEAMERGLAMLERSHGAFGVAGSLLRAAHPALLAGVAAGGAAVHFLRRRKPASHSSTKEN